MHRARRRPDAPLGLGDVPDPGRILVAAGAAVVVERHRRKHDRHGRRRGRCARQADLVQIRAQQIEVVLIERKAETGRDVGAVGDRDRPLLREQVGVRRALEQDLVVVLRCKLRAPGAAADVLPPVERVEGARDELALDIALQEALLVLGEQSLSVERIGERREAAPRHAGDDVHLVDQPAALAVDGDLGAPELFQHAVGERRGAGAAAGERQDEQRAADRCSCASASAGTAGNPHSGRTGSAAR